VKRNFAILPTVIIITSLVSIEAEVSYDHHLGSVFCAKPIRMEELDGATIVSLSYGKMKFVPIIYPGRQTIFQWIDSGDVNLLTYAQYKKKPDLYVKPAAVVEQSLFASSPKFASQPTGNDKVADSPIPLITMTKTGSTPLPSLSQPRLVSSLGDGKPQAFLTRSRNGEKVPALEKPLVSSRVSPLPHSQMFHERKLPPQAPAFADPNLMREYQRLVNSSTLGRIDSKREELAKLKPLVGFREIPANLRLKASKRTKDGRILPAQASEFYLTTQNLRELFKDMDVERALSGEVKSVAEIWAQAEKNLSTNPEVALDVKSILLRAKVGRARTDPFGEASLSDLPPDEKYFLIGIDKDENTNVVTIWSKQVEVNPGENEVELSSRDVIYQD
jgi:hypothetical protein